MIIYFKNFIWNEWTNLKHSLFVRRHWTNSDLTKSYHSLFLFDYNSCLIACSLCTLVLLLDATCRMGIHRDCAQPGITGTLFMSCSARAPGDTARHPLAPTKHTHTQHLYTLGCGLRSLRHLLPGTRCPSSPGTDPGLLIRRPRIVFYCDFVRFYYYSLLPLTQFQFY